ncbi:MAG TPA: T9SS type A sorting domain-containing protein, partial [Catalimonadaceae bacterium]|nr:T9SS type A sorting domain-containing protein [Catalimonadaceae bacterium]
SDSLVAGGCGENDGQGNINRKLILPTGATSYSFCYDRCFACFIPTLANVTTISASNVGLTTASVGGNVTGNGITEKGICYGTSQLPTTANSTVSAGAGSGSFSSDLMGLSSFTTYYARAFATNQAGTSYGNEISFITLTISVRPALDEGVESISPNPFSGEINISFSEKLESAEFVLLNVLGETILEGQLKNGKNRFVLSTIPSGIYHLKVKGNRQVYRLVKE